MQAAKFLRPDGTNPRALKEIIDNQREYTEHKWCFKNAGQRLIATLQKLQKTKQGNRNTIYSSLTSVSCRTMGAANSACIRLQNNATHMCSSLLPPRTGIPCPLLTWRPTPIPVQAQTGAKSFAKCKARSMGKGKRRHFITLRRHTDEFSALQHNFNKVCWSCHHSDAESKERGKRPSTEL